MISLELRFLPYLHTHLKGSIVYILIYYLYAEGTKANGGQRSQRRPTAAFLGTFSNVGNCSTFANGKEYNIYTILY